MARVKTVTMATDVIACPDLKVQNRRARVDLRWIREPLGTIAHQPTSAEACWLVCVVCLPPHPWEPARDPEAPEWRRVVFLCHLKSAMCTQSIACTWPRYQ